MFKNVKGSVVLLRSEPGHPRENDNAHPVSYSRPGLEQCAPLPIPVTSDGGGQHECWNAHSEVTELANHLSEGDPCFVAVRDELDTPSSQ